MKANSGDLREICDDLGKGKDIDKNTGIFF